MDERKYKPKAAALRRDGYICQVCGTYGDEAHHIQPLCYGGADQADNMIALCWKCHKEAPDDWRLFITYQRSGGRLRQFMTEVALEVERHTGKTPPPLQQLVNKYRLDNWGLISSTAYPWLELQAGRINLQRALELAIELYTNQLYMTEWLISVAGRSHPSTQRAIHRTNSLADQVEEFGHARLEQKRGWREYMAEHSAGSGSSPKLECGVYNHYRQGQLASVLHIHRLHMNATKPTRRRRVAAALPVEAPPVPFPLPDRSEEQDQLAALIASREEAPAAGPEVAEAQRKARLHTDYFTEQQVEAVLDRLAGDSDALVQCVTDRGFPLEEVQLAQQFLAATFTATWKLPVELSPVEKAILQDAIEGSTYAASLYDETGMQPQRAYAGRSRSLRNAARRLKADFGVAITTVPLT